MSLDSLLPFITGSGGALVVLAVGWVLIFREDLVTGKQHKRALESNAKLEVANDTLRSTNIKLQSQVDRLLDGANLSNTLAQALVAAAQQPKVPPGS